MGKLTVILLLVSCIVIVGSCFFSWLATRYLADERQKLAELASISRDVTLGLVVIALILKGAA